MENENFKVLTGEKNIVIDDLTNEIENLKKELLELRIHYSGENEKLQKLLDNKLSELKVLYLSKDKLELMCKELTAENLMFKKKVLSYELLVTLNKDISSKVIMLEKTISTLSKEKKRLEDELQAAGAKLEATEKKCYEAEQKLILYQSQPREVAPTPVRLPEERPRVYIPFKVIEILP